MTYADWRDAFEEITDPRFYPIEWLDAMVATGNAAFWANDKAAIVATIKTYPTGAKEVHGLVAAGELQSIIELIPRAEEWGREAGCIVAGISSRPGWAKALDGYEPHQIELRKELA